MGPNLTSIMGCILDYCFPQDVHAVDLKKLSDVVDLQVCDRPAQETAAVLCSGHLD